MIETGLYDLIENEMDWRKKAMLTNADLKMILDKHAKTLSRWRKKGLLEDNKIGGTYYYTVEWIEAMLRK